MPGLRLSPNVSTIFSNFKWTYTFLVQAFLRPLRLLKLLPSPSADAKFVLSVLKSFKHAQFFKYIQIILVYSKARFYCINWLIWVYFKNLSIPKDLRTLKTNFESADGLGISSDGPMGQKLRILIWKNHYSSI